MDSIGPLGSLGPGPLWTFDTMVPIGHAGPTMCPLGQARRAARPTIDTKGSIGTC